MDFFQTITGRKFYEHDIPALIKTLEKIGKEMEKANELKEQELELKKETNK